MPYASKIPHNFNRRAAAYLNKRMDAGVLMPIRAKREKFPDGYDKNAMFSVRMLIRFCMSSSYSLDANASSGRARIFHGFTPKSEPSTTVIA
jgi:hypothetical protein